MRNIIFAKTKKARTVCAVLAIFSLVLAVFAAYYTIGNLRCAADSPVLIGESGGAIFLGYYLLAAAYGFIGVIAVIACVIFTVNAATGTNGK